MRDLLPIAKYEGWTENDSRDSDELTSTDTLIPRPYSVRPPRDRYRILAGIALFLLISLSAAQIGVLISSYRSTSSPDQRIEKAPCGKTPEEAKARGCTYSWALGSWLPDACYDHKLEVFFTKNYEFVFYRKNATGNGPDLQRRIASPKDLGEIPHEEHTFTTWRYHIQHCGAAWNYVHRAGMEDRKLSALLAPLGHSQHCVNMILDEDLKWDDPATEAVNTFPDCVPIEAFKNVKTYG